jgi:NAD+ synthase
MRDLNYKKVVENIQNWIRDYIASANARGVILGLSGGIDSAVTAALSANALGKENVMGLCLPIESIPEDLEDAKLVAHHLGIKNKIINLTSVYKEFLKVSPSELNNNQRAMANIKPRLRMTAIYFIGQSMGYLVGGTGNRTEIAIGYFTKYGDGGVDFEPIGELYKCEVRTIARLLEIPEKIINKAPSAGLWLGQTDEGEIGMKYDLIDEILYRIDNEMNFNGLDDKDVKKVKKMMEQTEHKRKMPPCYNIIKD